MRLSQSGFESDFQSTTHRVHILKLHHWERVQSVENNVSLSSIANYMDRRRKCYVVLGYTLSLEHLRVRLFIICLICFIRIMWLILVPKNQWSCFIVKILSDFSGYPATPQSESSLRMIWWHEHTPEYQRVEPSLLVSQKIFSITFKSLVLLWPVLALTIVVII